MIYTLIAPKKGNWTVTFMYTINNIQLTRSYFASSFLFGLFTTFEVFKTEKGGITILYADIFYILFVLFTSFIFFCRRSQLKLHKKAKYVIILFFLLILSTLNALPSIIDRSFDPPLMDGYMNAIKYVFRNLLQLFVYILICFINPLFQNNAIKGFCYGFLTAIVIHSVYSIIQMTYMYLFLIDIHTLILNSIGITKDTIGHDLVNYIGFPIIRNSGFHWDPAYFGLWGCIGFSTFLCNYKIKYWIKYLITIVGVAWLFSFSRTGYFAFLFCIFFIILGYRYNKTLYKINYKKICQYIFYSIGILIIIYVFLPEEIQNYIKSSFVYRFTYDPESKGTSRHLLYPFWAFEGSIHDWWHFIFGYGPRNSSRGIAYGGNILDLTTNRVYDIESDFCKMLLSYGMIGFILYLLYNFYIIKYYIRYINFQKNSIVTYFYLFGIIGSFFAGIFYMYNDSKWIWYLYLFATLYLNNNMGTPKPFITYDQCLNNNSEL